MILLLIVLFGSVCDDAGGEGSLNDRRCNCTDLQNMYNVSCDDIPNLCEEQPFLAHVMCPASCCHCDSYKEWRAVLNINSSDTKCRNEEDANFCEEIVDTTNTDHSCTDIEKRLCPKACEFKGFMCRDHIQANSNFSCGDIPNVCEDVKAATFFCPKFCKLCEENADADYYKTCNEEPHSVCNDSVPNYCTGICTGPLDIKLCQYTCCMNRKLNESIPKTCPKECLPPGYIDYIGAFNPCHNGGKCTTGVDHYCTPNTTEYICNCSSGFTGKQCDKDINECLPNPCQHGGSCTDGINSYACICAAGYTGSDCATEIDECLSNPCQHGGNCDNAVNSYTCTCAGGYSGDNCESEIDECSPNPCHHGGSCTDGINSFTCTCAAGYAGTDCATDINECLTNPCQHGGSCTDGINSYTCTCTAGYSGTDCAIDINECLPNPCQHGGSCTDGINSYACICAAGYTGSDCATAQTTVPTVATTTQPPSLACINNIIFDVTCNSIPGICLGPAADACRNYCLKCTDDGATQPPLQTPPQGEDCYDRVGNGLMCADLPGVCNDSTTRQFLCPKHCGICVSSATTPAPPCINHMIYDFQCYQIPGICLGPGAHACKKLCRLCTDNGATDTVIGTAPQDDSCYDRVGGGMTCADIPGVCSDSTSSQVMCPKYCNVCEAAVPHTTHVPLTTAAATTAADSSNCYDTVGMGMDCTQLKTAGFCANAWSNVVCRKTCNHCNDGSTFALPTNPATTAYAATTADPCVDHTVEGITCTAAVCSQSYASLICPKSCGFCTTSAPASTGNPSCFDHVVHHLTCASIPSICNDSEANALCSKYCHLC